MFIGAIEAHNEAQENEENFVTWGPSCVPDSLSENHHWGLYPEDYRRFVEKVGWLNYSPGYQGLSVFGVGYRLGDMLPNEFGDYEATSFLHMELDIRGEKDESTTIANWAESRGLVGHELVAEDPCGYAYLALDKSTSPFTFVELIEERRVSSFLQFVIDQLSYVTKGCQFYYCEED